MKHFRNLDEDLKMKCNFSVEYREELFIYFENIETNLSFVYEILLDNEIFFEFILCIFDDYCNLQD